VDEKLDMSRQCVLVAPKANCTLAASPAAWAAGEGGDSASLLHSGDTPPGVLPPALEPSAEERPGAVGAGPEEGHKIDQRNETPLL